MKPRVFCALLAIVLVIAFIASSVYAQGEANSNPSPTPTPSLTPTPTPEAHDPIVPTFSPPPTPRPPIPTNENAAIIIDGQYPTPEGNAGDPVRVVLPLLCRSNAQITNIMVKPVISSDVEKYPFDVDNIDYTAYIPSMGAGSRYDATFDFRLSEKATKGVKAVEFTVDYTEYHFDNNWNVVSEDVRITLTTFVKVNEGYEEEAPHEKGALILETVDMAGEPIEAPSGNIGDTVRMTLCLTNRGGELTDVVLTPDTSADTTKWPFLIEQQNYGKQLPDMSAGDSVEEYYDFVINPLVTKGPKAASFTATYKENGKVAQSTFTLFVNVIKGAPEQTPEPTVKPTSQPKLIIQSYKLNPESIIAGNDFTLELTLTNTSSKQSIKNATITLKNADARIVPAPGGSNTIFFESLGPGDSTSRTLEFTARPDAEAKAHMLSVSLAYEDSDAKQYTGEESISVPVQQPVRVEISEPRVFADWAFAGTEVQGNFTIINMGKSQLYNVMVKADIDGCPMVEPIFGGNLAAGSSLAVDFSLIPESGGQKSGDVIVTFEDEYGAVTEKRLPLSFPVQEEMPQPEMDPSMMEPPAPEGMPTSAKIAICVGGAAALIIVFVIIGKIRARRRERELEE